MAITPSIYNLGALERLGITVTDVGTVMLELTDDGLSGTLDPDWLYVSDDPAEWWVKGADVDPHVTLLHGLLPGVSNDDVAEVLDGWEMPIVTTDAFELFGNPDADYACVVSLRHTDTPQLNKAHAQLSMLPHINFYPEYKPHVTVAYVKNEYAVDALAALSGRRRMLRPIGIKYSPAGRVR